jgi:hypothetical protein
MVYNKDMIQNNYKENIFTKEEIEHIEKTISDELKNRKHVEWSDSLMGNTHTENLVRIKRDFLGRIEINNLPVSSLIKNKVFQLAKDMYQLKESYPENISGITYVEYNPKYGNPSLNVHKDNGSCGLILDYQLESNTSWPFGVEESTYNLKNNSMLAMYPLEHYHWRPEINWKDGDFVRLIFFEFFTPGLVKVDDLEKYDKVCKFANNFSMEAMNEV